MPSLVQLQDQVAMASSWLKSVLRRPSSKEDPPARVVTPEEAAVQVEEALRCRFGKQLQGRPGNMNAVLSDGFVLHVLWDVAEDRFRLLVPICELPRRVPAEFLRRLLESNWQEAEYARYGLSEWVLLSTFEHQLTTLQDQFVLDAVDQVETLACNTGVSFAASRWDTVNGQLIKSCARLSPSGRRGRLSANQIIGSVPLQLDEFQQAEEERNKDINNAFCCPISLQLMKHPVITPGGYTYDRSSIESHLKTQATDPFTRMPLSRWELRPNVAMKQAIQAHKARMKANAAAARRAHEQRQQLEKLQQQKQKQRLLNQRLSANSPSAQQHGGCVTLRSCASPVHLQTPRQQQQVLVTMQPQQAQQPQSQLPQPQPQQQQQAQQARQQQQQQEEYVPLKRSHRRTRSSEAAWHQHVDGASSLHHRAASASPHHQPTTTPQTTPDVASPAWHPRSTPTSPMIAHISPTAHAPRRPFSNNIMAVECASPHYNPLTPKSVHLPVLTISRTQSLVIVEE